MITCTLWSLTVTGQPWSSFSNRLTQLIISSIIAFQTSFFDSALADVWSIVGPECRPEPGAASFACCEFVQTL